MAVCARLGRVVGLHDHPEVLYQEGEVGRGQVSDVRRCSDAEENDDNYFEGSPFILVWSGTAASGLGA